MSARRGSQKKERGGKRREAGATGAPATEMLKAGMHRASVPAGGEPVAIRELAALGIDARIDTPGRLRFSGDDAVVARILLRARTILSLESRLAHGASEEIDFVLSAIEWSAECPAGCGIAFEESAEQWRGSVPATVAVEDPDAAHCIGIVRAQERTRRSGAIEISIFLDRLFERGETGDPAAAHLLAQVGIEPARAVALFPAADLGWAREGWVAANGEDRPPVARAPGAAWGPVARACGVIDRASAESAEEPSTPARAITIFDDDLDVRRALREWGDGEPAEWTHDFLPWLDALRAEEGVVVQRCVDDPAAAAAVAARMRGARRSTHAILAESEGAFHRLFPGKIPAGAKRTTLTYGESTQVAIIVPPVQRIDDGSGKTGARVGAPVTSSSQPSQTEDRETQRLLAIVTESARLRRRWPERRGTDAYRLYDRDLAEIPLVVDRYGAALHITIYPPEHGAIERGQEERWVQAIGEALAVDPVRVFVKRKARRAAGEQHTKQSRAGVRTVVREAGLTFEVNLSDYVDTGLFLDHRATRAAVRERAEGMRFLNLFCYTGAFTVAAAAGGARETVSIDTSTPYLDWARENLRRNGLDGEQHRFVRGDALAEVRAMPEEPLFDLAFIDPPTRSNRHGGEIAWDVQRDHVEMIEEVAARMARGGTERGGTIIFSTNFRRFRLDESALASWRRAGWTIEETTPASIPEDIGDRRVHRCWWMRVGKIEGAR